MTKKVQTEQPAKPKKREFWMTRVVVTVLSEDGPVSESAELSTIDYMITHGDCSGAVEFVSRQKVSAKKMAKLLEGQGSDPGFFRLNADGTDADD